MRSDTVAAAVAAHYGVSKAQLLDAAAEDLPLRMALGEAQVCVHMFVCVCERWGAVTRPVSQHSAAAGGCCACELPTLLYSRHFWTACCRGEHVSRLTRQHTSGLRHAVVHAGAGMRLSCTVFNNMC